ncbi:DUF4810 domain-containing protein [Govanella unica]|uniref:DUF4810 domain-containing protein n=1 Tax=Govanella unica TaxID=2975056 RepID=A0A9X3TX47_9PROT|nr:DUF4810 domain-containing protein [Govania unica]MDA5193302.1 DUF4810 domain-containing protein [Govania unica]
MKPVYLGVLAPLILMLAACSTAKQKYAWGGYEGTLYNYYKNPTEAKRAAEAISKNITTAESKGLKVPPGLYAEYGYLQLELGAADQAIVSFEKEKAAWPESATLMNNMISTAKIPTKGPGQ